eukprot:gene4700-5755_t
MRILKGARLCVVVDTAMLHLRDNFVHGFGTLLQGMAGEYAEVVLLPVDESGKDPLGDTSQLMHALTVHVEETEEPIKNLRIETLGNLEVPLDMSPISSVAYNVMEYLKEAAPQFTAVHFLSPELAHFAALARQQGLALQRTPLLAHFWDTKMASAARGREGTAELPQLEMEYMQAAAAMGVDVRVVETHTVAAEVERMVTAHLVPDRVTGLRGVQEPQEMMLPMPASTVATQFAHVGGKLHQQCRKEHRCVVSSIVYWGSLDTRGGLEVFCNAVDELLEMLHQEDEQRSTAPEEEELAGAGISKPVKGAIKIEFIGRVGKVYSEMGYTDALSHLGRLVTSKSGHVKGGVRLAVLPEIGGQFAWTRHRLQDCLWGGLPVIASGEEDF